MYSPYPDISHFPNHYTPHKARNRFSISTNPVLHSTCCFFPLGGCKIGVLWSLAIRSTRTKDKDNKPATLGDEKLKTRTRKGRRVSGGAKKVRLIWCKLAKIARLPLKKMNFRVLEAKISESKSLPL